MTNQHSNTPPKWRKSIAFATIVAVSAVSEAGAFNHGAIPGSRRATVSSAVKMHPSSANAAYSFRQRHVSSRSSMSELNASSLNKYDLKDGRNVYGPKFVISRSLKPVAITTAALFGLFSFSSNAAVALGKKAATATATSTASSTAALALPSLTTLVLACLLPTLSGYYKSEYGVSYGYGTAMAASSYLILSSIANSAGLPLLPCPLQLTTFSSYHPAAIFTSLSTTASTQFSSLPSAYLNLKTLLPSSLPATHAFALLFYGMRLDIFLLYREIFLPRFRAMRERIEDRAKKQGARWKRTPFIVSCAVLYFCMVCPLLVTSNLCHGLGMGMSTTATANGMTKSLENMLRTSILASLLGFVLGALGDINKSIGKAIQGEDQLITWGIFRFFRHPNYTGEVIGWVSSCLSAFLAVAWYTAGTCSGVKESLAIWRGKAPYLILSVLGAMGISFVLGTATAGLEFRQKEKYGEMKEYQEWVKKSWVGFEMGQRKEVVVESEKRNDVEKEVGDNL
mmetsp:Transcript_21209/g.44537  ORF Transcript_21209/g.44537 Transcript_21209/m.44537 type:complete len:510 (-) Transcript_21209:71-1600(-)|eukprot:CAMPEP_0171342530 /NCGR_PEP_ID=MMETSP0878-20121228/14604_1 /TAXON_ID=67004 /ORGANISM="Thalassiosira weissflogii, Strain CCMP1336" /LENGTH=509 /DNA_ID=CAMNT_0011845227 /DNA_START=50 /DNA_END=1579 /DNA_ORIENTATION=+